MKRPNIMLIILAVFLIIYVVIETIRPRPINWEETFSKTDKIPFGTFVLYDLIEDLFPRDDIKSVNQPIFDQAMDYYAQEDRPFNYVFVNDEFLINDLDMEYLLMLVSDGNDAFISARKFSDNFTDTLHFDTKTNWEINYGWEDTQRLSFTNLALEEDTLKYEYNKYRSRYFFSELDSSETYVLGKFDDGQINFVRIPYGDGNFYLHTFPIAFTNYHVLKGSHTAYAEKCLSHLPEKEVLWDEYYKVGRLEDTSYLRYVFEQEALRWAWYILLVTALLFVIFRGKRLQRIIPIIKPPQNASLEFVTTVGNLYFQRGDHRDMAMKKATYFLNYLHQKLNVRVDEINPAFYKQVAMKSNTTPEEVEKIFKFIATIRRQQQIYQGDLRYLNQLIENFKAKINQ